MRRTSVDLGKLAQDLVAAMPALDKGEQRLAVELYRLLAEGDPIRPERLAERAGLSIGQVKETLEAWPGVFLDDEGRIIAFWGLAQQEMLHRLSVGGRQLSTWCAWDSLFIPGLIGATAHVESACPATGESISLTVGPDGVTDLSPAGAVLSFLRPGSGLDEDVIGSFCHYVHFFASEEAARDWCTSHEGTFILSVTEGFELGRLVNQMHVGAAL